MTRLPFGKREQRQGSDDSGRSSREEMSRIPGDIPRSPLKAQAGRFLRGMASRFHSKRVWLLGAAHLLAFALSYGIALTLRFDFSADAKTMSLFWVSLPWVVAIKTVVFFFSGHYDGWWSYVTFSDLLALLRASLMSLLLIAAVDHFAVDYQIPRGLLIIDCMITILLLGSLRASWRMFSEQFRPMLKPDNLRWAPPRVRSKVWRH